MRLYQFEAIYNEPEDSGIAVVVDLDAIVQFSEWPASSFSHGLPVTTLFLCKAGAVHSQSVMASIDEVRTLVESKFL